MLTRLINNYSNIKLVKQYMRIRQLTRTYWYTANISQNLENMRTFIQLTDDSDKIILYL